MRVECLYPWESTCLVYSIFIWKCLLIEYELCGMFIHEILCVLKKLDGSMFLTLQPSVFGELNLSFARGRAKAKCGGIW